MYLKPPYVRIVVSYRVHAQTFQLLTGKPPFNPRDDPLRRFSADDEHLLHMMQLTGQTFDAGMLNASAKAGEFFESNGKAPITCIIPSQRISFLLTRIGNLTRITGPLAQDRLIKAVQGYNKTESSSELHSSVTFIKRCLQLNPVGRASAADLLADPWLQT
jgi:serine/threonine protein kinase